MIVPQEILDQIDTSNNYYLENDIMPVVPYDTIREYFDSIPVEPPVKPESGGGHLIIYQDVEIMPKGFCGVMMPYWKINLANGKIEASIDKKYWTSMEAELRIELE